MEKAFSEEDKNMFRKCFIFYATISAETVNRNFDTSAIVGCKNEAQLLSSISGADAKVNYGFFEELMFN